MKFYNAKMETIRKPNESDFLASYPEDGAYLNTGHAAVFLLWCPTSRAGRHFRKNRPATAISPFGKLTVESAGSHTVCAP